MWFVVGEGAVASRGVAEARRLYLNDLCAHVSHELGAVWRGDEIAELHNLQPGKRAICHFQPPFFRTVGLNFPGIYRRVVYGGEYPSATSCFSAAATWVTSCSVLKKWVLKRMPSGLCTVRPLC